ncbi:hypothetical protein [Amycolatopsis palatopharyngis]|uniref:hypothetical protein n=1 Tax=Amycolatopsis palatopharyngis TaxID=187982 RepID=UPI000E25B582|nr:hypothetical protein [Amycolatopsis palatopharyngis]
MTNTLVTPAELNDFPGAPFTDSIVDAAVAALRRDAGWHIAPVVTETRVINANGGVFLLLPTRHLVDVTAVRDTSGESPVDVTGWRKSQSGVLYREYGWPGGFETIEADMVHGYAETPPELLPLIALYSQLQQVNATVTQEALGSWSRTLRSQAPSAEAGFPLDTLDDFTIRVGF